MSIITVKEIIVTQTGEVIKASEFFTKDEGEIFKQREKLQLAIQNKEKLWICPVCGDYIKIKGKWDGAVSVHFSHPSNNKPCPLKEKNRFTKDELLRYRYNGQKEGERHKYLKELIASKLRSDSRFSEPLVEKRLNGTSDEWRQPDVSTVFEGKTMAFEIQLSTTFLNVIAERKSFYKKNGVYLIWIFDKYHSSVENMRFTEKDIFFPNHHNAFSIDNNDTGLEFNLICGYEVPVIKQGKIERKFTTKKVGFNDLSFDDEYNSYYFNYDAEKRRVEMTLFLNQIERTTDQGQMKEVCISYDDMFKAYGADSNDHRLRALTTCILSIKLKRVVGYGHKKVIEILHIFLQSDQDKDEHYGQYIFNAIKGYGTKDFILVEDESEKFRKKATKYDKQKFPVCRKYDSFLKALFTELADF
jgi:competence CoiA-like predicted nuclease